MDFTRWLRSKSILWSLASGLLILGLYLALYNRRLDNRVYSIGWQSASPFQEKATDGSPAGLAIDLVRDAAQRRGIRLHWIWWPGSSEAALRSRQVDLWPLITITPERQRVIHISTPYLQHDYDLLVSATKPYSRIQDLASASISCTRMAIDQQFLEHLLPGAHLFPVAGAEDAIQDVCAGRTDAAFLDEFSAGAALLSGLSCSHAMRAIPVAGLRTKLGVGSTPEASAVADEIRRGIDDAVRRGDLEMILQGGGYFSPRNMQYFTALLDGQQRQRWLIAVVGVFSCLLVFTAIAADSIRRQRNRIKTSDQALRQSERRYRELLEDANLVGVMTDSSGAIDFWNGYAQAITGWSKDEVIGRPAREFLDPAPLALADRTGRPPALEVRQPFIEGSIMQKSGERRWIQWSQTPLRDNAGRTIGYASLGEDVTELRALRAEAARLESEERFRHIADTAPLMIWAAGTDKSLTFVNNAWLEFTGHTLEQELGDGWIASVHPDYLEYCVATYTSAFDARRAVQLEYRKKRADGEYRWVLGSGLPRFGADGQFLGYLGTCTDITDLKRARDENAERQKLESVGRLAGGIAHDFNNLLGSVLAQAELALADLAEGASAEEQLNNIRNVAIVGAGIVRQLMIYAGQESTVSELVDISALVQDMLDLLKLAVSKHAVVRTDLGRDLPAVQANPAQLRQVVMNLVSNGSEAIGDRGGEILIRTARAAAATSNYVEIEISDTGCGITTEHQAKLFEPFFTTKSAGHGLGLAVVHKIVQSLGGSIQVESEAGRGAAFRIVLPSTGETTRPAEVVAALPVQNEGYHTGVILLVEDEAALRSAAANFLRKNWITVMEAADGTAALNLIREHAGAIAVILLDLTLPGATSPEVFAEARRVHPGIKVVLTSAYSTNKLAEFFPEVEIDAFIRKPYRLAELVALVRSLLRGSTVAN